MENFLPMYQALLGIKKWGKMSNYKTFYIWAVMHLYNF